MKKLLIIIFSLISVNCFCQSLDSIKHIEIISEIRDSMALINKDDIDKTTDDFINAYIDEFGETNKFDLIEVHKLIKLSYCLGLKKNLNNY